MEYREAELHAVAASDVPDDNPTRFLRELRMLRNGAGLEHDELAARAHYPCDAILAAEAGPALPDLPVLSAYVRGCGGTVIEWEERWRTLNRSPALTLLPTREAGNSDAAAAGARIGSVSLAADGHDPAIIMAALGRVANGIAAEPVPAHSVFAPAAVAAPAQAPVPEKAALFAVDSVPEAALVPDADAAPEAATAPSGTPSAAAVADGAVRPGWTPTVVKPVSTAGRAAETRHSVPSKPLIAALVIVVCVLAIVLGLFA